MFLVAVQRFSFHSYKAPLDSKNLAPHRYKCYSKSLLTDINGSKPFSFVSSFFSALASRNDILLRKLYGSVDYKTKSKSLCTWRWFLWWSRTRSRTTSVCLILHRCDSVSNALGSWFSFLLFFELSMRSDRPLLPLLLSFYNNNNNAKNNIHCVLRPV